MAIPNLNGANIGYDTAFALNEFSKPKLRSEIELVKDVVLFILFAKPGQYPSLPTIGLDIETMLYSFYDEINEDDLKTQIIDQCEALGAYFQSGTIQLKKIKYHNEPSLLIHIEGEESYPSSYKVDGIDNVNKYLIGITFDDMKNLIYNVSSEGGAT